MLAEHKVKCKQIAVSPHCIVLLFLEAALDTQQTMKQSTAHQYGRLVIPNF